jgi:LEA14-like dessication related protein
MSLILQVMRLRVTNNSTLLWTAAALVLWITGCRQPEAPEYYGFQNLQVSKIAGGQTNLSATVKLFNPNPYSLQLKRAEVDVAINGKHAGHSLLDSTLFIPAKDTFYVPIALQVDLGSLFSNALQMLLNKQDATITLDGRVKIRRGALTFNRPFHYDGKQDLNSLLPSGSNF